MVPLSHYSLPNSSRSISTKEFSVMIMPMVFTSSWRQEATVVFSMSEIKLMSLMFRLRVRVGSKGLFSHPEAAWNSSLLTLRN